MLLELSPGLRVVRRGLRHVQVGLYDGRRVVLDRTATTESVLAGMLERQPLDTDDPAVAETVGLLLENGCAAVPPTRSSRRVMVVGGLAAETAPLLDQLLEHAGLARSDLSPSTPQVALVLSRGELERECLDPLVRSAIPHLVVRLVDGGVIVGPFVVPGRTACLRCLDAHESVRDPDHLPVLTRYVEATQAPRGDGRPDDPEPALVLLGLAWAVRDLSAHLSGQRPTTWSRTVHLGPEPARQEQTTWSRHPECGCSWPGIVDQSGKMNG